MEKLPPNPPKNGIHPLANTIEMIRTALGREPYGWVGKRVLEQAERSGRQIRIEGAEENIPKQGPYILAANHYVRVDNPSNMMGPQKMNDVFSSNGVLQKMVESFTPGAEIKHLQNRDPRPEAFFPKNATPESLRKWFLEGTKFIPSNLVRKVFLGMFSYTDDLVGVSSDMRGMAELKKNLESHLQKGGVIIIFPEGEVTQELREAKHGAGHMSVNMGVPIVPVSQFEKNGVLQFIVGKPIFPKATSNFMHMTNEMMGAIASNMPEDLRGFYKDMTNQVDKPAINS